MLILDPRDLRGTDNLFDVFVLLLTVILSESHEIQMSENWAAKKVGIEIFWVSDITFLAALPRPVALFVTFLVNPPLPSWVTR